MLLTEDPSLHWAPAPAKIFGLDDYPPTASALAEAIHFMMEKAIELRVNSPIHPKTVTAFVTEDHLSPFTALNFKQHDVKAVIMLYENLPDDALYYVSAQLRADAFVRRSDTPIDRHVFAMWDRCSGLSALTSDGPLLRVISPKSVSELLPGSVKEIILPVELLS